MTAEDDANELVGELISPDDRRDPARLYTRTTHIGEVLAHAAQLVSELRGDAITDMWDGGAVTLTQIAKDTGIGQQRVSQILAVTLRRRGEPPPKRGRPRRPT